MATPNIVPRADSEGGIGTASKYWASAYIDTITTTSHVNLPDNARLKTGTGGDFSFFHDGSNSKINNNTGNIRIENFQDDGDIEFLTDDGSGGTTAYLTLDGGLGYTTVQKDIRFEDNVQLELGTSRDMYIYSDGSNGLITNNTGNLIITNDVDDGDVLLQSDNGSGGVATYLTLDGGVGTIDVAKNMFFGDSVNAVFGGANNAWELEIFANAANDAYIKKTSTSAGDLIIQNASTDGDIVLSNDNGSGTPTAYLTLDGTNVRTKIHKNLNIEDNVQLQIGNSQDLKLYHNTTHSYISQEGVGNLYIQTIVDDGDIVFVSDNGAGGTANYFYLDGSSATHDGSATTALYTNWPDNSRITLGTGHDLNIYHDGSTTHMENSVGDVYLTNYQNDGDIIFRTDDGSGGHTAYLTLDGGVAKTQVSKPLLFVDNISAEYGTGTDMIMYHSGSHGYIENYTGDLKFIQNADDASISFFNDNGSGGTTEYLRIDGQYQKIFFYENARVVDSKKLYFGTGDDLEIYHDGSNSYIRENGTGNLFIEASDNIYFRNAAETEYYGQFVHNGGVHFYFDNVKKFETTAAGVSVTGDAITTGSLGVGGAGGTKLQVSSSEPYVTLKNQTVENTSGGCESRIIFEDHGDNALGQIEVSHEGTSDDEKGAMIFSTNNDSGLQTALTISSAQAATFAGDLAVNGEQFVITSSNDEKPLIHIKDTTNSVNGGQLKFTSDRGQAPVDGDDIGRITFTGEDAGQNATIYSQIVGEIHETAEGDESGELNFYVANDAVLRPGLQMHGDKTTSAQVDVTIANGAGSDTTIAGNLDVTTELLVGSGEYLSWGTSGSAAIEGSTASNRIRFYTNSTLALTLDSSQNATFASATGTAEGGGIDATDAVNISVGTINGEIITTINVDIGAGGILSSSTAGDVIGNDGVASAYITRLTTAINGIVYKGEMICVEVPTTGDPDINLAASSESGIAEDQAGEGQHVLINGGVATLAAKNDITIPSGGIVGDYLYLTHGGTTAGTYDAGQFIIKLYGAATL